jgi:hypothetical protein
MTAPHYISEDNSDMRGIKPGWYAIEDDGNLSSGPFSHAIRRRRISPARKRSPALPVYSSMPERDRSLSRIGASATRRRRG